MRLSTNTELIVLGVLILYIAFTPGFPVVRQFLSTPIGKAVGLAVVVYVWKYVSEPVALLLTVNFIRCAGMREYLEMPKSNCPEGYNLQNNVCKKEGSPDKPATVCADPAKPNWNAAAEKCEGTGEGGSGTGTGGGAGTGMTSSSSASSGTGMGTGGGSGTEGFQPSEKKETFEGMASGGDFAPAF